MLYLAASPGVSRALSNAGRRRCRAPAGRGAARARGRREARAARGGGGGGVHELGWATRGGKEAVLGRKGRWVYQAFSVAFWVLCWLRRPLNKFAFVLCAISPSFSCKS